MLAATYGVIEGPERGWTDPLVLAGLVGGAASFGAFVWWQRRDRGVEPVVDPVLWRQPAFRWGALTAAVASLAFFGAMFVVPQYLRGVLGEDALGTGLRSVPMVLGLFVGPAADDDAAAALRGAGARCSAVSSSGRSGSCSARGSGWTAGTG